MFKQLLFIKRDGRDTPEVVLLLTVTACAVERRLVAIETEYMGLYIWLLPENDRSTSSLTATPRFLSPGKHMAYRKSANAHIF